MYAYLEWPKGLIALLLLREATGIPRISNVPSLERHAAFPQIPTPINVEAWQRAWSQGLKDWPTTGGHGVLTRALLTESGVDRLALANWLSDHSPVSGYARGKKWWSAFTGAGKVDDELSQGLRIGVLLLDEPWYAYTPDNALLISERLRFDLNSYRQVLASVTGKNLST